MLWFPCRDANSAGQPYDMLWISLTDFAAFMQAFRIVSKSAQRKASEIAKSLKSQWVVAWKKAYSAIRFARVRRINA